MMEEESGACELHQVNRLLYSSGFLPVTIMNNLDEFLPGTSNTQCSYCASEASCLGTRLRLSQSLPKMNMERYKPSKEWSSIPQEYFSETHICIGLFLPIVNAVCETSFAYGHSLKHVSTETLS